MALTNFVTFVVLKILDNRDLFYILHVLSESSFCFAYFLIVLAKKMLLVSHKKVLIESEAALLVK